MTSRDAVNVIQRRLRAQNKSAKGSKKQKIKVGHCGTLDPLAEGVLVIAVGPAVRLVPYVQQQHKHYLGAFRLGASSETGDLENGFDEHADLPIPTHAQIDDACKKLTGAITQVPPAYSAIWIDGQRAYDRVRRGESVEMPSREVDIYQLTATAYDFPTLELDILCGSGTYIRTLGIDVARECGSMAVMTHLKRIGIGEFKIDQSMNVDQMRDEPLDKWLQPASMAVGHLPRLNINANDVANIRNGIAVSGQPVGDWDSESHVAAFGPCGDLCAIVRPKRDAWWPYRVFPAQ